MNSLTTVPCVATHGDAPHSAMNDALVQIDRQLLSSIADSMSESKRKSGDWIVCQPGCMQCCLGPFAITQLDAMRLRNGLAAVVSAVANRIRQRAAAYVEAIAPEYPGDPATGELFDEDRLPESMDPVPCPVLDPQTGRCDLYDWRPIKCRVFGPATCTSDGAIAACELCYVGATQEDFEHCAVEVDPDGIESDLLTRLSTQGYSGTTIVAYAIARS